MLFGPGHPVRRSNALPGRANCMRDLVDIRYPDAETIRVVQDNLSTYSAGALYQTFPHLPKPGKSCGGTAPVPIR